MDAEVPRYPFDRVIHTACFFGPDIEHIDFVARPVNGKQHCVNAVAHVKIGFALLAIAKDVKPRRITQQSFVKIEDMAVRVALTEDRDEAKNVSLKSKSLAISLDH